MAEQPERDEQTEDPTQKRLDEAFKRGDVPKSQEVGNLFVLAAGTLVLLTMGGTMARDLSGSLSMFLGDAYQLPTDGG
ncbi:MAG: EscU/YscU/HrcU family type III secretion system export apparatus switch protein, partial [Pseudomonadota bacterium]